MFLSIIISLLSILVPNNKDYNSKVESIAKQVALAMSTILGKVIKFWILFTLHKYIFTIWIFVETPFLSLITCNCDYIRIYTYVYTIP